VRGASWHKTAKPSGLAHTVNGWVVQRKFMFLSGEVSGAWHPDRASASGRAPCGNVQGDAGEVSRRHSSPTPEVMLRTW
jgi:hypothetical protein